jgi:hypothetical protein
MGIETGRDIARKATWVLERMLRTEDVAFDVTFVTENSISVSDEYVEVTLREFPDEAEVELVDAKTLDIPGFHPTLSRAKLTPGETVIEIRGEYEGTGLGIRLSIPDDVVNGGGD